MKLLNKLFEALDKISEPQVVAQPGEEPPVIAREEVAG